MNKDYYNVEIENNFISIFKGFKLNNSPKLKKVNTINKNDWWKKYYIYEKYSVI